MKGTYKIYCKILKINCGQNQFWTVLTTFDQCPGQNLNRWFFNNPAIVNILKMA